MHRLVLSVRLRLVPTADGGRQSAICGGYRPDWNIGGTWEGQPTLNGGRVELELNQQISPGDEGDARVSPLCPELWIAVKVGDVIPMHEGARVVGHATVIGISRA